MYDNHLSWIRRSGVSLLAVGIAATALTACGGSGMSYTSPGTTTTGTGTTKTPSSITLASPGQSVNRTVALTASPVAGMGVTVTKVTFMVDGASIGTAGMSPYTVQWDTSTVSDGTHSLTATVTDSSGSMVASAAVSVTVLNNPMVRSEEHTSELQSP